MFPSPREVAASARDVLLEHMGVMLDGFLPGRAAEPFADVFDFVGCHGRALPMLFGYTVIERGESGEVDVRITRDGFLIKRRSLGYRI